MVAILLDLYGTLFHYGEPYPRSYSLHSLTIIHNAVYHCVWFDQLRTLEI